MSRTLSLAMLTAMFAQETQEAVLVLLTISHPKWVDPLRAVMNGEDVSSRGNTFTGYPFDIIVPDDTGDRPPQAQLTIDNVSREITHALESTISPVSITIEIVLSSTPNTVEISWSNLTLKEVKYNAQTITGTLVYEDLSRETFPKSCFTPTYFPGLF